MTNWSAGMALAYLALTAPNGAPQGWVSASPWASQVLDCWVSRLQIPATTATHVEFVTTQQQDSSAMTQDNDCCNYRSRCAMFNRITKFHTLIVLVLSPRQACRTTRSPNHKQNQVPSMEQGRNSTSGLHANFRQAYPPT